MKEFVRLVINFFKTRFYVNSEFLLYVYKIPKKQNSPVKIVKANNNNISDILHFQEKRYLKMFKNFLSIGDIGYLGYINNKCIHRSWVKKGEQIVRLQKFLPYKLNKNQIFIHMCETAHEARGKNIYPTVLCKIIDDFKDNYEILIAVDSKNISSIKGIEKAGFILVEKQKIKVILGIISRKKQKINVDK